MYEVKINVCPYPPRDGWMDGKITELLFHNSELIFLFYSIIYIYYFIFFDISMCMEVTSNIN